MELKYKIQGREGFFTKAELSELATRQYCEFPLLVAAELDINFTAEVDRTLSDDPDLEYVVLTNSTGMKITVARSTSLNESGLGVSCDSLGEKAKVDTINITFRGYENTYIDRGTVWVYPGEPAIMLLSLLSLNSRLAASEIEEIFDEAEQAVQDKLTKLFTQPQPKQCKEDGIVW